MALLTADVAWLQRHSLMDYSFLIGYINKTDDTSSCETTPLVASTKKPQVDLGQGGTNPLLHTPPVKRSGSSVGSGTHSSKDNRFAVRLLPVVDPDFSAAYVGIIDILTQYGTRKRAEHCCLGILANRPGASCQPPNVYGNRMVRFVDLILLATEEAGGIDGMESFRLERSLKAAEWMATHGKGGKNRPTSEWGMVAGLCCWRMGTAAVLTREEVPEEMSNSSGYDSVSLT